MQGRALFSDPSFSCDPGKVVGGKSLFVTNPIHHTFGQPSGHSFLLKLPLEQKRTSRRKPDPIPNQSPCELLVVQEASLLQPKEAMGDFLRVQ